jgi:trans-aconitate methyltransferase
MKLRRGFFMKPKHLEPKYSEVFKNKSVSEAYIYRPPYPMQTFDILNKLIAEKPSKALDVGCGTGNITRYLINFVDYIDAIDSSESMIMIGKSLPQGNHSNINWICSTVEEASLNYQYNLITAGASLHWMDWNIVLPKFKDLLLFDGYLAIINDRNLPTPWEEELLGIIKRYSTNQEYKPYNLVNELEERKLYKKIGEKSTEPKAFKQSLDEYIESFHARNGFSREIMSKDSADRFDNEVRNLLLKYCSEENVEVQIIGDVVWGKPLNGKNET